MITYSSRNSRNSRYFVVKYCGTVGENFSLTYCLAFSNAQSCSLHFGFYFYSFYTFYIEDGDPYE